MVVFRSAVIVVAIANGVETNLVVVDPARVVVTVTVVLVPEVTEVVEAGSTVVEVVDVTAVAVAVRVVVE